MSSLTPEDIAPIEDFINAIAKLNEIPKGLPTRPELPPLKADAPVAACFIAHPDDEVLAFGLINWRLRLEGWRVVVVAMTLGEVEQVGRRREELRAACGHLGFELRIANNGKGWHDEVRHAQEKPEMVHVWVNIQSIIMNLKPRVIITHAADDAHPDHVGTNILVQNAIAGLTFLRVAFVKGEWWATMSEPNLQLGCGAKDLAILRRAAMLHGGEMNRMSYHALLVAKMYLNRMYTERVMGWGCKETDMLFTMLYRVNDIRNGMIMRRSKAIQIHRDKPLTQIFAL